MASLRWGWFLKVAWKFKSFFSFGRVPDKNLSEETLFEEGKTIT